MTERERNRDLDELDALLAKRAIEALDRAESARLDALLGRFPDQDADRYERIAAAVLLAVTQCDEAMPESLARRLDKLAAGHLSGTAYEPGGAG